jgi:hypothetical protein
VTTDLARALEILSRFYLPQRRIKLARIRPDYKRKTLRERRSANRNAHGVVTRSSVVELAWHLLPLVARDCPAERRDISISEDFESHLILPALSARRTTTPPANVRAWLDRSALVSSPTRLRSARTTSPGWQALRESGD